MPCVNCLYCLTLALTQLREAEKCAKFMRETAAVFEDSQASLHVQSCPVAFSELKYPEKFSKKNLIEWGAVTQPHQTFQLIMEE